MQSDSNPAFCNLFITSIFSLVVLAFSSIIDEIIENSLSHLCEMKISFHSIENLLKWNSEFRILSSSFSPNISNSWNHP
jgi:hypothetical protein